MKPSIYFSRAQRRLALWLAAACLWACLPILAAAAAPEVEPPGDDPILKARVLRALPDDAILAAYIHDLKQTRERLLKTGIVGVFQENDIRRLIGLLPAGAQPDADTWYARLTAVLEKQISGEIAFALIPPRKPGGNVEPVALIQVDDLAADLYDALRANLKLAGHWSDLPVTGEDIDGAPMTCFSAKNAQGQPEVRLALGLAKVGTHGCLVVGIDRERVAAAMRRFVANEQPSQLARDMLRSGVVVPDLIVHANKTALRKVNDWLQPADGAAAAATGLESVDSVSYSFSIDGLGFREAILFHCKQRAGWLEALTHKPLSDRAFAGAPTSSLALMATTIPIQTQGEFFRALYQKLPNNWELRDKLVQLWPAQLSINFDQEIAPALTGEWTLWASLDQDVPKPSMALRLTQADPAKATALFESLDVKLKNLCQKTGTETDAATPAHRKLDAAYRNFVITPPNLWFMLDSLLEPTVFITNNDLFVVSQTRDALNTMRLMTALNQVALADTDDFRQLRKKISPTASTVIYLNLKRVTKILYEIVATTKLAGNVDLPLADTFVSHLDNVIIGLSATGDEQHPSVLVESYAPVGPVLLADALLFFFLSSDTPAVPPVEPVQ